MLGLDELALGEAAALTAAFFWAMASAVYARLGERLSPLLLNLSKGVIAMMLLGLTLAISAEPLPQISLTPLLALSISGVIGIGLGDTLYFETLQCLGVRLALLLGVLTPSITSVLGLVVLKESLSAWAWGGMMLTLLGIAWVTQERATGTPLTVKRSQLWRGLGLGGVAVLTFALSALLSRSALANTPITPLWGAFIRIGAGVLSLMLAVVLKPKALGEWRQLGQKSISIPLVIAALLGTYLGIWLQQMGFKYAPAGIAQTLNSTSPIFILILARLAGQPVSLRSWVGTAIALVGVGFLLMLR